MLKKSKKFCPELVSAFLYILNNVKLQKKYKMSNAPKLSELIENSIFLKQEIQNFEPIILCHTIKVLKHSID